MMRAVRRHARDKWVILYIERWLKAPVLMLDGSLVKPGKGTPQGGVISPLLANLFLHYALDRWMAEHNPTICFERYADDVVYHCKSERQAEWLWRKLKKRLDSCGLEGHPQKTKIVYCKDANRRGNYHNQKFDFLGYEFRPRQAKNRKGVLFVVFSPAVSPKASKAIRQTIREWRLRSRVGQSLEDLAYWTNPIIRGWIQYYSRFRPSAFYPPLQYLNLVLVRWVQRKYKRLRSWRRASRWLRRIVRREPGLFAHWRFVCP
jgi:RNA-directed DNA polymerase